MATAAPRGVLGRMMLRKSVAQVQEETRTSELKRSLGPWNLVFLGIGCIIGAGIFVRTGNAAGLRQLANVAQVNEDHVVAPVHRDRLGDIERADGGVRFRDQIHRGFPDRLGQGSGLSSVCDGGS